MPHTITIEQYQDAMEDSTGFCTNCGEERECCEPDADGYHCDACGQDTVQGCDNMLVMGLVE